MVVVTPISEVEVVVTIIDIKELVINQKKQCIEEVLIVNIDSEQVKEQVVVEVETLVDTVSKERNWILEQEGPASIVKGLVIDDS